MLYLNLCNISNMFDDKNNIFRFTIVSNWYDYIKENILACVKHVYKILSTTSGRWTTFNKLGGDLSTVMLLVAICHCSELSSRYFWSQKLIRKKQIYWYFYKFSHLASYFFIIMFVVHCIECSTQKWYFYYKKALLFANTVIIALLHMLYQIIWLVFYDWFQYCVPCDYQGCFFIR